MPIACGCIRRTLLLEIARTVNSRRILSRGTDRETVILSDAKDLAAR
jgi:hypothetical protein